MLHGNSELKRGQVSLLALMLMTLFLNLTLAHQKIILLYFKGNQPRGAARIKDEMIMNALHIVRQDRSPGHGTLPMEDETLEYTYRRQQTDNLTFELAVGHFENRNYWPDMAKQWITVGTQHFSLVDYWREP